MHKIVWCSYKPSLQQKKVNALQTYIISTHYIPEPGTNAYLSDTAVSKEH
jgi:hypothetical protein